MKLFSLIKNLNCRVLGSSLVEISGLYHLDTEVKENGLFFCLRGTRVDGTNYVASAVKNGAVAIVTEQEIPTLSKVTQVVVKNAREFMSILSCRFYGNPANKLKIIGVTGTNGKTTITNLICDVLISSGKKCALIGTNGVFIQGKRYDTGMTTPDPIELQKYFLMMVKSKIEYVCMEVSAHAIDLNKIDGFRFDTVVFTNLTEDHLDYFKTMERYFQAKSCLFQKKYANFAVLNADDAYGKRLASGINLSFKTYAITESADATATEIAFHEGRQSFVALGKKFTVSLAGKFNVSNALAAILVLNHLGLSLDEIKSGLEKFQSVDGRFNIYSISGISVVIDYAHTPDGLKNALLACREIAGNGNKLISVFGCGGNREVQKRAKMGEISSNFADLTVITSDNPRFEAREKIASDIVSRIKNGNYKVILDRSEAIKFALNLASPGDVVLLAGKGAEPYIDENGTKIPYSDKAEVEKFRRK